MIFKIYGCFLLGFYIGRHELYSKLELGRPILKRLAIGGLALWLPLNAVYAATFDSGSWLETLSGTFGILPLSFGYVALCCWIWLDSRGQPLVAGALPVWSAGVVVANADLRRMAAAGAPPQYDCVSPDNIEC